jgi:hypothetical protein
MPAKPERNTVDLMPGLVRAYALWMAFLGGLAVLSGCNFIPDVKHKPQYHNPFPQISKVAVLPFRNQSQEPTLSGARVSMAYYNELQEIRGFEVVPFGVVENQLAFFETQVLRHPIMSPVDFQQFAKHLGVDAVLQGAITDYEAYYPPRMTMKVSWYAANPGFHPIPVGYGLPWGTKKEKKIPEWIRLESERGLAAEQMKTQLPAENAGNAEPKERSGVEADVDADVDGIRSVSTKSVRKDASAQPKKGHAKYPGSTGQASREVIPASATEEPERMREADEASVEPEHPSFPQDESLSLESEQSKDFDGTEMPANWPDPQGFIPRSPTAIPPELRVQYDPIISHMRTYNGNNEDFTQALEEYFYFRDDARFGGWQAYLQRSEDFIRFCCHQHIVETLSSRGGQLESRMILRWPINRYER